MIQNKFIAVAFSLLTLSTYSCSDYLSAPPDDRITIKDFEGVRKLLTSAYPNSVPIVMTELSSDNTDDNSPEIPYTSLFYDEIVAWKTLNEYNNIDGPNKVWSQNYLTAEAANEALEALDQFKLPQSKDAPTRGEALLLRAYAHFTLVNLYSKPYNPQTSNTDLGIPYMLTPDKHLNTQNKRGNVAEVYAQIAKDIEAGIPLINDSYYDSEIKRKYHFNKQAAYAFAARFYLYYQDWSKAEEYATKALANDPIKYLRQWSTFATVTRTADAYAKEYTSETSPTNFLILPIVSNAYGIFSTTKIATRYGHSDRVSREETIRTKNIWGVFSNQAGENVDPYWSRPFVSRQNFLNQVNFPKYPTYGSSLSSSTNTLYVAFNADETLLVRAEARILLGKYDEAVEDLNLWSNNFLNVGKSGEERQTTFTKDEIVSFYKGIDYSTEEQATLKKELHPSFSIKDEVEENLLHHLLQCRRILTLHEGLRWYDIRRYGITVYRHQGTDLSGIKDKVVDILNLQDPRRTLQLPAEIVDTKLTPNPR